MTDILYPTKTRRFMSEVAGVRRYHGDPARATAAARVECSKDAPAPQSRSAF